MLDPGRATAPETIFSYSTPFLQKNKNNTTPREFRHAKHGHTSYAEAGYFLPASAHLSRHRRRRRHGCRSHGCRSHARRNHRRKGHRHIVGAPGIAFTAATGAAVGVAAITLFAGPGARGRNAWCSDVVREGACARQRRETPNIRRIGILSRSVRLKKSCKTSGFHNWLRSQRKALFIVHALMYVHVPRRFLPEKEVQLKGHLVRSLQEEYINCRRKRGVAF